MDIQREIRKMAHQPISYQVASSLLMEYKNPNDKLHGLVKKGFLQPIRKGLYIAGRSVEGRPEPILLANHILGPSYVTAETALSWYGLIPERVYGIVSATIKPSRAFHTPAGVFSYQHLPLPYYSFGLRTVKLQEEQYAMMASPVKALFDKIVFTPGLVVRSKVRAKHLLEDDLRIEVDDLRRMDLSEVENWLAHAPKRDSLTNMLAAIQAL